MSVLDELRAWFTERTLTAGVHDSVTVEAGTLAALLDIAEAAQAFLGAGALIVLDGDAKSRDAAARAVGDLHGALARLRNAERAS